MTNTATVLEPEATVRPYHHGDLRRALTEAALRIVERDGLPALSLRAVAREAGVSPAAPYHHFKDKQELMLAVGAEGFARLGEVMLEAKSKAPTPVRRRSVMDSANGRGDGVSLGKQRCCRRHRAIGHAARRALWECCSPSAHRYQARWTIPRDRRNSR